MKSLMKGGSQWGSNKTMVNSRNTSTLNTKLLILAWNCPCLPVLHHIPTNGQWPAALPNAGPHEPESFLLFWNCSLLGLSWSSELYESMQVWHLFIYPCIRWCISTRDQMERTGRNRHQPPFLSAEITGVSSLVPELFVSGGFPWWYRISYSRQNK